MTYKINYMPLLAYGTKTWMWTEKHISRLQAVEMKFVQSIMN